MAHQCELTYFLKCHEFVKIGRTCNLKPRVDDLQVGNPYDLELIGVSFKAENNLQEKFLHLQHKREWFHLTNELKDYIAKNAACPDEDGNFEEPEEHRDFDVIAVGKRNTSLNKTCVKSKNNSTYSSNPAKIPKISLISQNTGPR